MTIWTDDDQGLDRQLIVAGFVTKFLRESVLDETSGWLIEHGYRVAKVDAGLWRGESDMHDSLASALDFPDYYGGNLDALMDCLRDVSEQAYGWHPGETGIVLVIDGYEAFSRLEPEAAQAMVDIIATAALQAALRGNRMLCLLRCEDPWFEIPPVGAQDVWWNPREWMDKDRLSLR